jgi:tellurite resistance protein TerC
LLSTLTTIAASSSDHEFAEFHVALWVWFAFLAVVLGLLVLDLLLLHRTAHVITTREAAIESAAWVSLGLAFAGVVAWAWGGQAAGEYVSGYLIEQSLSVDNVFVWAIIMSYFAVPREFQFRVLFWGVFGAVVLRFAFIFAGVGLLNRFEWLLFVFGGFLIFTAIRLLRHTEEEVHPERNPVLALVRRVVPSTTQYHGHALFTKEGAKRLATPLFAVLVVIETSDVIFAVDSIPAILAVSRHTFIVFSSNAFAILGLRSMYFLLADLRDRFDYLQPGLAVILAFVGSKMILDHWVHIPTAVSLGVIVAVLAVAIVASIALDRPDGHGPDEAIDAHHGEGLGRRRNRRLLGE